MPSTTSPAAPPSKFTLFPHLPPELRLQIYQHACHPRVTTLTYHSQTNTFRCPTHPPTLLHVSRESRAEGLRLYVRCLLPTPPPRSVIYPHFSDSDHPAGGGDDRPGREEEMAAEARDERYFYHHPAHDTLYLPRPIVPHDPFRTGYSGWTREFAARLPGVVGVVRRLALDYVPGDVRRPWEVFGKVCLMRGCPELEEAYLVIGSGTSGAERGAGEENGEGREVEFVDPRADDGEIVGIMERVRESFRFELGDGYPLGLSIGGCEEKEGEEVGLELVPKVVNECGRRHAVCAL